MGEDRAPSTMESDALRKERKIQVYAHLGGAVFAMALIWLAIAVKLIWGFDFFRRLNHGEPVSTANAIYIALGFSVLVTLLMLWRLRSTLIFIDRGVEIVGLVTSVSPLRGRGKRPVRFAYEYEGRRYYGAADIPSDLAATLKADSAIVLIVDAKKPKRATPKMKIDT